jgi:exonuclease III
MKLINLNAWGGVLHEGLFEFIKKNSTYTDIFCFQEIFENNTTSRPLLGKIRTNLFSDIKNIIPEFNGYLAPAREDDVGGLAIFIKKSFVVNKMDHIIVFPMENVVTDQNHEDYISMGRDLQHLEFNNLGKTYSILNFHGIWQAKGKIDTKKRIGQSHKIKKIFDEAKGARILCGDLNQNPDTKSMDILSEGNMNLIREYKITSTRSSLYTKPLKSADYIIVSPEVEVKDFKVLPDEVSDHLPLFLEFN